MSTRVMPNRPEAEEHVISCCLLDNQVISKCLNSGINGNSFYIPANGILFAEICDLYVTKPPVTLEVLADSLMSKGKIGDVGGFPYLMQVTGKVPTTAHADYFIDEVKKLHSLREVIKGCRAMAEGAYKYAGEDINSFMSPHLTALMSVQNNLQIGNEVTVYEAAERAEKIFTDRMNGVKCDENLVSWGFEDFDRILHPMSGGEMIVVAARPSVGKTSLTDQIALMMAKRGDHVHVFSLEEKTEPKIPKFAQQISGHSSRHFKSLHKASQMEFLDAIREVKVLSKYLHIHYKKQTLGAILATIRAAHDQGKCKAAIIDYLQLMQIPGFKGGERLGALSQATRDIKLLANDLDIPIIVLSQLNRASAKENREPQLFDLRESGTIEQDADRVILIHRPESDPITGQIQDITDDTKDIFYQDIIQAKGRSVGTFRVGMYFKRSVTTFRQIRNTETRS